MRLDENVLKTIRNITNTPYTNPLTEDDALDIIEELVNEIEHKEDELDDIKQDIENNYELKNFDPYEEFGMSERDFF